MRRTSRRQSSRQDLMFDEENPLADFLPRRRSDTFEAELHQYLSSDANSTKPLLSGTGHRKSVKVIEHIKRSISVDVPLRPMTAEQEFGEIASEDIKVDFHVQDEDKHIHKLMGEVRNLPLHFAQKRYYMAELNKAADEMSDKTTLHHYIKIHWLWFTTRIPEMFEEIVEKCTIWNSSCRKIEGTFGTSVLSYFIFLRWLLLLNVITFLCMFLFIMLPEYLGTRVSGSSDMYSIPELPPGFKPGNFNTFQQPDDMDELEEQRYQNVSLIELKERRRKMAENCSERYRIYVVHEANDSWFEFAVDAFQGAGWMMNTSLLIGYYHPAVMLLNEGLTYHINVAFVFVFAVLILVNLMLMLSYATKGVHEELTKGTDTSKYCTVLCGWDSSIVNPKAARHQYRNICQEIRVMLTETRRNALVSGWTKGHKAKVVIVRIGMHLLSAGMIAGAYQLIVFTVGLQSKFEKDTEYQITSMGYFFLQFLPPFIITVSNLLLPFILSLFIVFEEYSKSEEVNISVLRIFVMRIASIIMLSLILQNAMFCEPKDQCGQGEGKCHATMCWETFIGQQLYRLSVTDFLAHVAIVFAMEKPWAYATRRWKNQITRMLGDPYFDIPVEVICMVYSQSLIWLGMFYCPFLPFLAIIKTIGFFYLKKYTALNHYTSANSAYKASRSNTIFVIVLMISYFTVISIVGYSVTQIEPSYACGPFRYSLFILEPLKHFLSNNFPLPSKLITYLLSPFVTIPILLIQCLVLYFFFATSWAHENMVRLLKMQLAIESQDRQFLIERLAKIKKQIRSLKHPREHLH